MVESVIETNDKEVGSHPCAVCASDPQGGPHSGCDEFQCSGCQKPEQFEAKELGFDEQDAIIQQAKLDKIEKRIEFVDAEVAQRVGRKIGRDIGILYGLMAGVIVFVIMLFLFQKLMTMV